jgi:hypothetical protein
VAVLFTVCVAVNVVADQSINSLQPGGYALLVVGAEEKYEVTVFVAVLITVLLKRLCV